MGKVEQAILDILNESREIYQSDLVRQTGYSRSRVSEVLSLLEKKGRVSRAPLGKNFRVILNGNGKSVTRSRKDARKTLSLGMIRASEYPFIIPFEKLLRDRMGVTLRYVVYDNGINLSRDLSQFRLDLGIAPVLTHFVFFSTGSPIKMIAPAGSGGAAILANTSRKHSKDDFTVATTKLSTMELMLRSSMNDGDIPRDSRVEYCSSPGQMINAVLSGEVDATCIWEPYSTQLMKKRGFKRLVRYNSLNEEHICCALAAGNHLEVDFLSRIAKTFRESIDEFRKNQEKFIPPYAAFMRFDEKTVNISSKEYSYPTQLDHRGLAKQFEKAGVRIPIASSVKEAVLPSS